MGVDVLSIDSSVFMMMSVVAIIGGVVMLMSVVAIVVGVVDSSEENRLGNLLC